MKLKRITFPCLNVRLVDADKVIANDYNPNKVASQEIQLLKHSIEEDGVTQPIVVYYSEDNDTYIVVDGFHRHLILTKYLKLDKVPVVVIKKDIKDRIASTIRHNRARGKHKVDLMSDIVVKLLKLGWDDIEIAKHLGMEAEEVLRLKQTTGMAEIFKDHEFSRSWEILKE